MTTPAAPPQALVALVTTVKLAFYRVLIWVLRGLNRLLDGREKEER